MHLKLKRVAPLQAGKLLGAFYGIFSLLFVPFILLFMGMASFAAKHGGQDAPPLPLMFGMGMGFVVFLPFFYGAMGFIFGALGAWVYNLLAKWLGGLELEFDAGSPPAP